MDIVKLTAPPDRSSALLMVARFFANLLALMAAICSIDIASLRDLIWSVIAPPLFLASSFSFIRCYKN